MTSIQQHRLNIPGQKPNITRVHDFSILHAACALSATGLGFVRPCTLQPGDEADRCLRPSGVHGRSVHLTYPCTSFAKRRLCSAAGQRLNVASSRGWCDTSGPRGNVESDDASLRGRVQVYIASHSRVRNRDIEDALGFVGASLGSELCLLKSSRDCAVELFQRNLECSSFC